MRNSMFGLLVSVCFLLGSSSVLASDWDWGAAPLGVAAEMGGPSAGASLIASLDVALYCSIISVDGFDGSVYQPSGPAILTISNDTPSPDGSAGAEYFSYARVNYDCNDEALVYLGFDELAQGGQVVTDLFSTTGAAIGMADSLSGTGTGAKVSVNAYATGADPLPLGTGSAQDIFGNITQVPVDLMNCVDAACVTNSGDLTFKAGATVTAGVAQDAYVGVAVKLGSDAILDATTPYTATLQVIMGQ